MEKVVELATKAQKYEAQANALASEWAVIYKAFLNHGFTPEQSMDLLHRTIDMATHTPVELEE